MFFYSFILSGFSTQNDGEFLINIIENHSELFSIALLTAELHQDFLDQLFITLCDFLYESNFRAENLIKSKLSFEALNCTDQETRHIVENLPVQNDLCDFCKILLLLRLLRQLGSKNWKGFEFQTRHLLQKLSKRSLCMWLCLVVLFLDVFQAQELLNERIP